MSSRRPAPLDVLKQRDLPNRYRAAARRPMPGIVEPLESRRLFAAGDLDATFGADGRVTTDNFGGRRVEPRNVVVQGDGKVVVAGHAQSASGLTTDAILVRYNANGTLDSSFGTAGIAHVDFGGNEQFVDLVLLGDGKIVAGGRQLDGKWMLARFTTAGRLDANSGFGGTDGIQVGDGTVNALTLQSGKIITGGENVVRRHLATTGALDTTFGAGGTGAVVINNAMISGLRDFSSIRDVDVQTDGKILVLGAATGDPNSEDSYESADSMIGIARLTASGAADTSFGNGGGVQKAFDIQITGGAALAVRDSDGRIVVAGSDASLASTVAAWNADGSFVGVSHLPSIVHGPFDNPQPAELMFDDAGRVIVAAAAEAYNAHMDDYTESFYAVRYTLGANGSGVGLARDHSFEGNGYIGTGYTAFGFEDPESYSNGVGTAALTPDGKIVLAGWGDIGDDDSHFVLEVARIDTDGTPITPPGAAIEGGVLVAHKGADGDDEFFVRRVGDDQVSVEIRYGADQSRTDTFDKDDFTAVRFEGLGGDDTFHTAYEQRVTMYGGAGDDTFECDEGSLETIFGGDGNDRIGLINEGAPQSLDGGAGTDTLVVYVSHRPVIDMRLYAGVENLEGAGGGSGPATIIGNDLNNRISAAPGFDGVTLRGMGGDDTLIGADGNDALEGGDGNDSLDGGDGTDTLTGGPGTDTLLNGEVTGDGLPGLTLSGGVLTFTGTGAAEQVSIWRDGDNLVAWLDGAMASYAYADVTRIELSGNGGNDLLKLHPVLTLPARLAGGAGDDKLIGGAGHDTLLGNDGNDHMTGNSGDDTLDGGLGSDVMRGNNGRDTLDYASRLNRLIVGLDNFQDDGEAGENDFAGPDIERLYGGSGNDRLGGSAGENSIYGGPGNDTIGGGAGRDALFGEGGNDKLDGGDDDDYFEGGAGHDALYGGGGADTLLGLAGNDRLFADGDGLKDSVIGGAGTDSADVDVLDAVSGVESTT